MSDLFRMQINDAPYICWHCPSEERFTTPFMVITHQEILAYPEDRMEMLRTLLLISSILKGG